MCMSCVTERSRKVLYSWAAKLEKARHLEGERAPFCTPCLALLRYLDIADGVDAGCGALRRGH